MKKPWIQVLFFCGLSFLFYFVTINRGFVCDDYIVLKRVVVDKTLWIPDFFRPLSDIAIYFNYLLGGFNAKGYYVFNILIHGINSFLLFRFCLQWKWTENMARQQLFAFVAGLLFLTYPFHNESVVWMLGRASLLAATFGILALVILVSGIAQPLRIFLVCLCWFIGLASYESIFFLPVMVLLINDDKRRGIIKRNGYWILALTATFVLHLAVRIYMTGGFFGTYGRSFFTQKIIHYSVNIFKVTGRFFLPPVQNADLLILLFALVVALIIIALIFFFKKIRLADPRRIFFLKLLGLILITAVIPVLFSVSTKTSESDRFLYFPSFFLCSAIAFLLVNLLENKFVFFAVTSILIVYNIFFLEKNNFNWIKASDTSHDILTQVAANQDGKNIFIINLPDESDGAFIFRTGFDEALQINGMNRERVKIVNHLMRDEMLPLPEIIVPQRTDDRIFISPMVNITISRNDSLTLTAGDRLYEANAKESVILYWNKQQMKLLR